MPAHPFLGCSQILEGRLLSKWATRFGELIRPWLNRNCVIIMSILTMKTKAHKPTFVGSITPSFRRLRIALSKWLWPKTIKQGELFTIIRWLRDGRPWIDGSWVGETLRADIVDGPRISFSVLREFCDPPRWERVRTVQLIPDHNCDLLP